MIPYLLTLALLLTPFHCIMPDNSFPGYGFLKEEFSSQISIEAMQSVVAGVSNNSPVSLYYYGLLHYYGISVTMNRDAAVRYFMKSANLNFPEAQAAMGYIYLAGEDVNTDAYLAFEWFSKSCLQKNSIGCFYQARMLYDGTAGIRDVHKAVSILQSLIQSPGFELLGSYFVSETHFLIGQYLEYYPNPTTTQTALSEYRLAYDLGHIQAGYHMSLLYFYGRSGAPLSIAHSKLYLQRLANENKHAESCKYLGMISTWHDIDYTVAINWFELCITYSAAANVDLKMTCAGYLSEIKEFIVGAKQSMNDKLMVYKAMNK